MVQGSPPLHWRKYAERYRLTGSKDAKTGKEHFPAKPRISGGAGRTEGRAGLTADLSAALMPREGKIVSWTQMFSGAPTGFEHETPYFLAIIELPNGVRLITQLADSEAEKVKIGAKVRKMFRKISDTEAEGHIAYGYKFKVIG